MIVPRAVYESPSTFEKIINEVPDVIDSISELYFSFFAHR